MGLLDFIWTTPSQRFEKAIGYWNESRMEADIAYILRDGSVRRVRESARGKRATDTAIRAERLATYIERESLGLPLFD